MSIPLTTSMTRSPAMLAERRLRIGRMRTRRRFAVAIARAPAYVLSDEARLFALTFLGGFVFTSLFIA